MTTTPDVREGNVSGPGHASPVSVLEREEESPHKARDESPSRSLRDTSMNSYMSPSGHTKKLNGISRRSNADREMERQIVDTIGKGPTRRFGPVCQAPSFQQRIEKLKMEHLNAYMGIQAKYKEHISGRRTPSSMLPEDFVLRAAVVHRFDQDRAFELLRRMEARFFLKTAKDMEKDLKLRVCIPLPFLKTRLCQDVLYFMPSRFPVKEMRSSVVVALMSYILNSTWEKHRDNRRKMCLIVNLDQWSYDQHFRLDCWLHLMDLFQGRTAPMKVSQMLMVNAPDDFLKAWNMIKTLCNDTFLERVHFLPNEETLDEYMTSPDYTRHLPDDFAAGKTRVDTLVRDFVAFRVTLERLRKGKRAPTKASNNPKSPCKGQQNLFKSSLLTLPKAPSLVSGGKPLTSQSEHGLGQLLDSPRPNPNRRSLLTRNLSDPTLASKEYPEPIIELDSDSEDESVTEFADQDVVLTAVQFQPAALAAQAAESISSHSRQGHNQKEENRRQNTRGEDSSESADESERDLQKGKASGKPERRRMHRTASMPRILGGLGLRRGQSSRNDFDRNMEDKLEQPLSTRAKDSKPTRRHRLLADAWRSGRNLLSRTASVSTMGGHLGHRTTSG